MKTITNTLERDVSPRHLRTFLAVCKHLSFTRAAEERFLTQPAVSRQMKQLERALGAPLFETIGKSIGLTDAGRALRPLAENLLGQIERMAEVVGAYRGAERGRLRIGASTTPGYYILPPVIGRFHQQHPKIELDYVVENSLVVERRIVHNELDLGFVGGHLSDDTLCIERLTDDELVCFCGASHPLAGRRRIPPGGLRGQTWVVREKGSATREMFERWTSGGMESAQIVELNSPEAIKALVREGVGLSFMSIHGLRKELREGSLRRLPIAGLKLKRPILVVRHPGKHVSPAMESFTALARSLAPTSRP